MACGKTPFEYGEIVPTLVKPGPEKYGNAPNNKTEAIKIVKVLNSLNLGLKRDIKVPIGFLE